MRHMKAVMLCMSSALILSACEKSGDEDVARTLKDVNVIDESNLNDVMLTVADPNEAVAYFTRSLKSDPDRIDLQRGLAQSLIRAKRATEAEVIWAKILKHKDTTEQDKIEYADALIRTGNWAKAEKMLDNVPPTLETYKRYRLEAMIADSNKEWKKADSFYETAVGLTTQPAGVLNNWGYSKMARGDYTTAERLFGEAITYDPALFTAKNNMVMARGVQGNYTLPILRVSQPEKAQLLHTLALAAIKKGDTDTGKELLRQAIEVHPQHFEAAVQSLRKLENG